MMCAIKTLLNRFKSDTDGVAAVEFALLLPFMATLYFGFIEVSFLLQADRQVRTTAVTLADLVSRTESIGYCEAEDVFEATRMIINTNDRNNIHLRLTSVYAKDSKTYVDWSYVRGDKMTSHAKDSAYDIEKALLVNGESVMVAEVVFEFDSALGYFISDVKELNHQYILRPRLSDEVEWVGPTTDPGNC